MADQVDSRRPRNIVLLSDGTGNSSAKLIKTNVWRLYEALDVSSGDQLAVYDNGVGTSSLKPLAVLGGGIGWGLKRNVRDLYMFACRNYRAADGEMPADRLFAFGFSRGAFTIRVLNGLIADQGLITDAHGPELKRLAKWAYREYRRQFNSTGGLVTLFRWLRDRLVWLIEARKDRYDKRKNRDAPVTFLGLWDTVDAYGLPLDEMTRGWDKWVWPLSMCERIAGNVEKICHAVALDDERHTFHPVLLNEADAEAPQHTDQERVTQVWFAGMHSNVGGGYPDDSLAHVSLRWMASEATKKGLRLHAALTKQWDARADPHGPMGDSRAGLGSYYRYNPRSIQKLTADRYADVRIAVPKIHCSVLERIAAARDDYAPIVLPETYAVVGEGGALLDGESNIYEHPSQASARCADQERVWNLVWFRRVLYFATVLLTLVLLLPPLIFSGGHAVALKKAMEDLGIPQPGAAKALIDGVAPLAPSLFGPWVNFYRDYPELLALIGIPIIVLMVLSTRVQAAIGDRMRLLWSGINAAPGRDVEPHTPPTDVIYRLRTHRLYRTSFEVVTQQVFPPLFGLATLLTLALVVSGTLHRALFSVASASGWVCTDSGDAAAEPGVTAMSIILDSRERCQQTSVRVVSGHSYRVQTHLPNGGWNDGDELVASPAGYSSGSRAVALALLPFRRVLREQWFVPIARVGVFPSEHHALKRDEVVFTPRVTGALFLFVNDVALVGGWQPFYANNDAKRVATIDIQRVEPPSN